MDAAPLRYRIKSNHFPLIGPPIVSCIVHVEGDVTLDGVVWRRDVESIIQEERKHQHSSHLAPFDTRDNQRWRAVVRRRAFDLRACCNA